MNSTFSASSTRELERIESYDSTKRFYDKNAETYSEETLSLPMDSLEPFAARLKGGVSVVDLGCGAGRDLRAFSRRGFSATGLDISYPLARLARTYSECPVVIGDLRALPFANNCFAGAWASASLLHLRRGDIQVALAEVLRILQPGGYFFSSLKSGDGEGLDSRGRWFTYFELERWIPHLVAAGLNVVETTGSWQASLELGKQRSVEWFSCIAQRSG